MVDIIEVTSSSPRREKTFCERLAEVANFESHHDFGIFNSNHWTTTFNGVRSKSIFFLGAREGRFLGYVIYQTLPYERYFIRHAYTVPFARRQGFMTRLLTSTLPRVNQTPHSIWILKPVTPSITNLWAHVFRADTQRAVEVGNLIAFPEPEI